MLQIAFVGPLNATFMTDVWHQYIRQRDWIRQRVTGFATADDADLPVTKESAEFEELFVGEEATDDKATDESSAAPRDSA